MLKDKVMQSPVEGVYMEEERRTLALSYLITNLFEAKSLDKCLDVAIKGLSMLDFFQSQITLLEDGCFVVKRNHMDKKYQFLLERIGMPKFLGHKIDARSSFISHLLNSKIVTTLDIKDTVKVRLEDIIKEYLPKEGGTSKRLGIVTRVVSIIPKKIDLLMLPLNYQGKVIGAVGISSTSLGRKDFFFLQNLCKLFAQAFEKVQTRDDLRKSEEKLRSIFSSSPDAVTVTDLNGNITECNQATLDLHGYSSKEEVIGKSAFAFIAKKDHKSAMENLKKTLEQGSVRNIEYTFLTKDGREFSAELSASVIKDSLGNATGFVAITKDITERKQMEEKFKESEERFRNLFESIQNPLGVFVGREWRLVDYNNAFKRLSGYTDEELKDKTFLDFVHPDDHALVLEKYRTGYPEEKLPLVYEIRAVNKKGEIIPLEISVSTYKVKGKVVGIEVIHRDITERKKIEQEIAAQRAFRESVLNSMVDGIATVDLEGVQTYVSPSFCKMVGYEKSELERSKPPFLYWPPEKLEGMIPKFELQVFREKDFLQLVETVFRRKNGEQFPVSITVSKLRDDEGKVVGSLACVRDLTEKKVMEEKLKEYAEHLEERVEERTRQLKKAQEQLLKSERLAAIGELATMVGHDLRNPLQAIENATYYLNNELSRLPPSIAHAHPQKAIEMLHIISDSVNYADKIIRDLQDFSATKKLTLKKTNINAIVKEAQSQVEAPENVELVTELGHLPEIKVDKDMIKRVFLNLALNGIQAMENGGRLKVSTKKTKEFVEVSFEDTGIGMSKENMEKLFKPFFTTKAKGMGMGLAICKKLVDPHGGSIKVESEEGKGSTFTVKLPIQRESEGENP